MNEHAVDYPNKCRKKKKKKKKKTQKKTVPKFRWTDDELEIY